MVACLGSWTYCHGTVRCLLACALFASVCACATQTQVRSIDLSERRGAYLIVYVPDPVLRRDAENQLVADLADRGILAFASHRDVEDITRSSPSRVRAAAMATGAAFVLLVNPVERDGSGALVDNPRRVSPEHPDLQAFYAYSRERQPPQTIGDEVIIEVNLFVLGGERTNLLWSGTAWSFEADGKGRAVPGLSQQIADAMAQAKAELLGP